jgi:endonuclease-3 related protein
MIPSTRPAAPLRRYRRIPGPPRDRTKARLLRLFASLARRFGPQHWWPGRTPFEVAAGAVLTQHTAWTNVERALAALRSRRLLEPRRLDGVPLPALERLLRPAGTYRLKARRLRAFVRFILQRFDGRVERLAREPLDTLRRSLLAVPGLGPETADAILLYAAGRPVFVVDAYTRRVLARHRLIPPAASYEAIRAFVKAHLPSDPGLFNEYHALLVAVGKRHCRTVPRCRECPLRFDLHGRPPGPV